MYIILSHLGETVVPVFGLCLGDCIAKETEKRKGDMGKKTKYERRGNQDS